MNPSVPGGSNSLNATYAENVTMSWHHQNTKTLYPCRHMASLGHNELTLVAQWHHVTSDTLVTIVSGNGLYLVWWQAITTFCADLLSIKHQGANWRRPGDKPLTEPMVVTLNQWWSLGLNELTYLGRTEQQHNACTCSGKNLSSATSMPTWL